MPYGITTSIVFPVILEEIAVGMVKAVIKLSPDNGVIELPLLFVYKDQTLGLGFKEVMRWFFTKNLNVSFDFF